MARLRGVFSSLVILLSLLAFGQSSDSVGVTHSAQIPPRRSATAACSTDRRTDPKAGVVISEVLVEGTSAISSGELSTIKSRIIGTCFDEDSDIIAQAIRSAFSDEGFAQADVGNVTVKASDTLAVPKTVAVKAEVTEGPRFRIGAIKFTGNHAFNEAKLRAAFPFKKGDLFRKSKFKGSFEGIRKLYIPKGYEDLALSPDVMFSSTGTVSLSVSVSEGPQYHMGDLKIYANKEIADRLASEWNLRAGAVFDGEYPNTFLDKNHSLPTESGQPNIVLVRNCPEYSIAVLLIVDQTDPGLQTPPKEVRCKKSSDSE